MASSGSLTKGNDGLFLLEALVNVLPSLTQVTSDEKQFLDSIKDALLLRLLSLNQITCVRNSLPVWTSVLQDFVSCLVSESAAKIRIMHKFVAILR